MGLAGQTVPMSTDPGTGGATPAEANPGHTAARSGSKLRITLVATPIVLLTIAVWVGNALAPTLIADAPYVLLTLSPRLELAALVSHKVGPAAYYLLPLARASMVLTSWYLLGHWYNDRALRWAEDRSGKAAKPLLWVERNFNKARYPITFLFPMNITAMLAGAGNMNPVGFFGVALTSIVLRYWAVRSLAQRFSSTVLDVSDFINQYQQYLTFGTIALVVGWVLWSQKDGIRQPDSIEDMVEDFEPETDPAGR